MSVAIPLWTPVVFCLIALFYAMVGFGGGSSYLAVLVLAGLPYHTIPPIALACNLIVTTGGCWHFYRAGHFKLKNVLPFIVTSIPMAYLGGRTFIGKELFCILLGLSLLVVAVRLALPNRVFENTKEIAWSQAWMVGLPLGAVLGLLAGLVGIGGGIFLSPLLLVMRWVHVKEAAATASFFIVVNSLSGLMGQLQKEAMSFGILIPLALAVLVGGQIGSRLGAYRVPKLRLQRILAVLMLYVSVRLISEAV